MTLTTDISRTSHLFSLLNMVPYECAQSQIWNTCYMDVFTTVHMRCTSFIHMGCTSSVHVGCRSSVHVGCTSSVHVGFKCLIYQCHASYVAFNVHLVKCNSMIHWDIQHLRVVYQLYITYIQRHFAEVPECNDMYR